MARCEEITYPRTTRYIITYLTYLRYFTYLSKELRICPNTCPYKYAHSQWLGRLARVAAQPPRLHMSR